MASTIAFGLLIALDFLAVLATVSAASKFARGWFSGIICGAMVELIRVLAAMGITNTLGIGGRISPSDTMVWLINLRLFNIPILLGLGYMAGLSAAQEAKMKKVLCPHCQKESSLNTAVVKAKSMDSREYQEACPHCHANVTYNVDTFEVVAKA